MKKTSFFAILTMIILLSSSVLYGCDLTNNVSANAIHNKYMQIVSNHTVYDEGGVGQDPQVLQDKSLFNEANNLAITYAESNLRHEIVTRASANPENAIFSVFNTEYPTILYSSLSFFNYYRHNLLDNTNEWSTDHLKEIYSNLLEFEKAVKNFNKTKLALENISINYDSENLTSPYSYSTMVKYNDFKQTYQKLILSSIELSKSFEKAFFVTIASSNQFLEASQVPYYEIRRSIYSASVYLAEATYHYYFNHNDGFLDTSANLGLYDSIVALRTTIRDFYYSDGDVTNILDTNYYRTLRAHEKQVAAQSGFYVNAIALEKKLKNSTKPSDISLYNDYVTVVNEATQNYCNYASYAIQMIVRVSTIV